MLKENEMTDLLIRGVEECRHLVFLAIKNGLPINEAPCFSWSLENNLEKAEIQCHSTKAEVESFFFKVSYALGNKDSKPLMGIIPLKKKGQVGYLIFISHYHHGSVGLFQYSPSITDDKKLVFNQPSDIDADEVISELTQSHVYH